jgi:flagellar hook protein FlgE
MFERMSRVSSISRSGLNAAAQRLSVAAADIANVSTPGYTPRQVEQVSLADGGTATTIVPALSQVSTIVAGQAAAPSSVDLAQELTQILLAQAAFKANARVLEADDKMQTSLLDVLT